tara:strand:+ start:789 stop:995 length:207 start_codon:yes stop_codon:yes gene_type:complete
MYNTAFKAYANLPLPRTEAKKQDNTTMGLLSRGPRPKNQNKKSEPEPRQRIANYVMEIRNGRRELKND